MGVKLREAKCREVLSLQEHPVLGRPFYMLHPCRTAEVMALLRSSSRPTEVDTFLSSSPAMDAEVSDDCQDPGKADMKAYFIAWWSVYGSLLGLALPRSLWPEARRFTD